MATECSYKVTLPNGEVKELQNKDELHDFLLRPEVSKDIILPPTGEKKEPSVKEQPPVTGIRNSAVNQERLSRGLLPVVKEASRKFGRVWQEAKERVITGTTDPRNFVSYLYDKVVKGSQRIAVTDTDNAIILMDRIDLTNQRLEAMDKLDAAQKTGNDNVEALAWQQLQIIEHLLQQNDELSDRVGTITAQALSSRRMLATMDYNLVSMKREIAKYYPKGEVPKEVVDRLAAIEKEHAEAVKKLSEYEEKWKQQQAQNTYDKNKPKKEKGEPKKTESSKSIKLKGKELADKIRQWKKPPGTYIDFSFGTYDLAVEGLAKLVEAGATVAEAIDKLLKDKTIGFTSAKDEQAFRDHFSGIDEEPAKSVREKSIDKIKEIATNTSAETINKDMVSPLRKLINDYAKNGEEDFNKVLDAVHSELKDSFTDLTKENIRDAYSGYGDVKLDTKNELQRKINDWKKEATLLAQMDDVIAGERPQRKSIFRGNPSEKIEKMRKDLETKMKSEGISWENSPSTETEKHQRALQSLKTRVQNEIDQLTYAIENKKPLPEKGKTTLDDHAKGLIAQRDNLKDIYKKLMGIEDAKTLTDAERIDRAEKQLDKQIQSLSEDIENIKKGEYSETEKRKTPETATLRLMRGRRDALKELKRKLTVDTSPKSSESAIALERYKDSMRNKILDYQRRIEQGDFEEKEKAQINKDAEAIKLELEQKRAKTAFTQEKIKAEKVNRTKLQKIYDKINAWKRFSVLTGIPTMGKLFAAVTYRNIVNPIEELTGSVLHIIPGIHQISKQAPREGGFINIKAEGSALAQWAKAETYRDAKRVIKEGQSELDYRFGKYISQPPEALEVMGRIHGAMKNFAKRNEFARAYEKRMQYAVDHGADPSDELSQLTAMSQAYIDANRSIFMQDNWLVNLYNRHVIGSLEQSENKFANFGAALLKFLIPIVKIPTNFIGESINYSFGSLRTVEVLARALTGHLNDMSPEAADGLMRSLKKGSIGAGMIALGYYNPSMAGGYFVRGLKKENEEDPDWGELDIMGLRIPRWATHFPLFEAIQLGSTMRRITDKDIDAGKTDEGALTDGVLKSARGLIGEVPLFNAPEELFESIEGGKFMDKFAYPELYSMIPLGVQNVSQWLDTNDQGDVVKRKPEGVWQQLEYRVPGLRQDVEEK